MTIPLLPLTATSLRQLLRSAHPSSFTVSSIGRKYVSYDRHTDRNKSFICNYSGPSPFETSKIWSSPVISALHRYDRFSRAYCGHGGKQLQQNHNGGINDASIPDLPFFKNSSKLPPSSSSILKQENHELSTGEVRLKNALQEYIDGVHNEKSKLSEAGRTNERFDDKGDYLLENLQRAYMDLEYWEEALQMEVYKCQYLLEDTDEYADSIHAQGKFYLRQENFIGSKRLYEKALDYFERTENIVQQGHVLISLAGWYFFRNQLDDALESLQRSETMLDSNPALLYKCLDNQGLIYRLWGEFHVALDKYQQALQVVVDDDTETRTAIKMHIADMYLALEEPEDALEVYQDLLKTLSSTSTSTATPEQHQLGMHGVLLHNIATIHVDIGEHDLALEQFLEALEAKKLAGGEHNPEVAKTLNSLGALHAGSFGEKEVALEYFHQALLIARIHAKDSENHSNDPDVINALQNISLVEQDLAGQR